MPSHRWESPLSRSVFDHAPDDDTVAPLWNAGVYTEKDLLRIRKILAEKKVQYLGLHAEMIVERARRRASELFSKSGKLLTLGDTTAAIVAACSSIDDYGVITKRIASSLKCQGEKSDAKVERCSFGKLRKVVADDNDHLTISSILHSLLDCIADGKNDFASYEKIRNSKESTDDTHGVSSENVPQCSAPAVPLTMFCISHQMLDENQLLFVPCSSCHSMCADIRSPPLCGKHLRDLGRAKRTPPKDGRVSGPPAVKLPSGAPMTSTPSKFKTFDDPTKPLFGFPSNPSSAPFLSASLADKKGHKRVSADVQTKEEAEEIIKRFKQEASSAQLSLADAVSQGQSSAVTEAIRLAELRRSKEDAFSCSRIRPFERSQFPPKPSTSRKISSVSRPSIPVRRPFVVEGASLQSQVTMQAHHATYTPQIRQHAGSDSLQYRQLSTSTSRKPQPTHRYLVKAQQPGDGNEVLIEDRRTPPPLQNTHGNGTSNERTIRSTTPLHSRHLISSYRRQVPGATLRHPHSVQSVREDTSSHGDVSRVHSSSLPTPDPPILPLPYELNILEHVNNDRINCTFLILFSFEKHSWKTNNLKIEIKEKEELLVTTVAPASPRSDLQQTQGVQDDNVSNSDSGTRLLSLSPTPSTLRQRFPTILRKTDSLPFPTQTALSVSPSSSLNQRPTQPNVAPRPPPASRPLPPHRLIQAAVRAVPPHRLIKTLPLPTVPPPRPPKPFTNTDGTNTEVSQDVPHGEQQLNQSSELKDNEKDSVVEKSGALMSKDTEALCILAAVSEAAAAAVPNSSTQSSSKENLSGNADDDDEFEEEM
ncbi:hypothetical protein KIN20_031752 [Parelaphostrongylus tenuis]|uniref:Potential DNA-binding domain-containing protein n=1 Tax=Parelaphostrongylus tenuis TaxID=148309 RepID=A0AAD5WH02_PARTN|nr:hypothetical protein KIN20_031752 [Parelaphostrongylus tenuis]